MRSCPRLAAAFSVHAVHAPALRSVGGTARLVPLPCLHCTGHHCCAPGRVVVCARGGAWGVGSVGKHGRTLGWAPLLVCGLFCSYTFPGVSVAAAVAGAPLLGAQSSMGRSIGTTPPWRTASMHPAGWRVWCQVLYCNPIPRVGIGHGRHAGPLPLGSLRSQQNWRRSNSAWGGTLPGMTAAACREEGVALHGGQEVRLRWAAVSVWKDRCCASLWAVAWPVGLCWWRCGQSSGKPQQLPAMVAVTVGLGCVGVSLLGAGMLGAAAHMRFGTGAAAMGVL
jgi:hypothetical protein